jgi:hypothetical protein
VHCVLAIALIVGRLAFAPSPVAAQGPPEIDIRVSTGGGTPAIAVRNVLGERQFGELMRNGFPARLRVRAELWVIGRYFDEIVSKDEWQVIVRYDLVDKVYEVARVELDQITSLGAYARFQDARRASEIYHAPSLAVPPRGRKGYIAVQVEAQTVELSDLDEVQRWLRGEARPAVQGRRSPGTAIGRGVRTLMSRLLGGEVKYLEERTPTIQF